MKCKHQTGEFSEMAQVYHTRVAGNGILDPSSLFFNVHIGNIIGYSYRCWGCKKMWRYDAPNQRGLPKWLAKLHYNVFSPDDI